MKRMHLFEFEDLRWFPTTLRNMITDFLQRALILRAGVYKPVVPLLKEVMRRNKTSRIVDLCSGASGPWLQLHEALRQEDGALAITLTDKYPNLEAFARIAEHTGQAVGYETRPVDATDVPGHLEGVRTIFTGFHHFRPELASRILQDAVRQQAPICVFEFTERRWKTVLLTPILAPLLVCWSTLLYRPLSLTRLFWTFILPVVPLAATWDGVVSNLRTYMPGELEALVSSLPSNEYVWRIGRFTPEETNIPITYLLGYPRHNHEEDERPAVA